MNRDRGIIAVGVVFALACAMATPLYASWSHSLVHSLTPLDGTYAGAVAGPDGSIWEIALQPGVLALQRVTCDGAAVWPSHGLTIESNSAAEPVITSDDSGGVWLGWARGGQPYIGLYAQHVGANGVPAWQAGGRVVGPGGIIRHLVVDGDGTGGLVAAWDHGPPTFSLVRVQRLQPNGDLDPSWPELGARVTSVATVQHLPRIAGDGAGGAFIGWIDDRGVPSPSRVVVQHLVGSGVRHASWPALGILLGAAHSDEPPILLSDRTGGVFVVWTESPAGGPYRVVAQHLAADGSPVTGWPAGGREVASTSVGVAQASAVRDGAGGLLLAWQTTQSSTGADIAAHHVRADGSLDPTWPAEGAAACASAGTQQAPTLTATTPGQGVVAWVDLREAFPGIYAQHLPIGSNPSPGWTADGRMVWYSSTMSSAPGPVVVATGGGSLVGFGDWFGGSADVRVVRVDDSGYPGEPAPAVLAIDDIRLDQGGAVSVVWSASYLDSSWVIDHYDVERGVPGTTAGPWIEVAGPVTAIHRRAYARTVATTLDSTPYANVRTPFRVIAHDATNTLTLVSAVSSGYSADDLAPVAPPGAYGYHDASNTYLRWLTNPEPDLSRYRVYRGDASGFPLDPGHRVAEPTVTFYDDTGIRDAYYALTAVDLHGNESPADRFAPDDIPSTGIGAAAALRAPLLDEPQPCPARSVAWVRFGAPPGAPVRLEVFDVSGRRVRQLYLGDTGGATHSLAWDLTDARGVVVANGLYLVRMSASGRHLTRRLVIAR
ncbi:MAG: FlgD immunoglobulin-like domain containing protein [Candidatus Eisenbacteria bacterium]